MEVVRQVAVRIRWIVPVLSAAALLSGLFAVAAHGGVNSWTNVGPEGGFVAEIVFHPTNSDVAYLRGGVGLYKTTNDAQRWELKYSAFRDGPRDLAVDPTNGDRVAAVDERGLHLSTDGGSTFSLPSAVAVSLQAVEFSRDGSTLYAAGSAVFFRSTDKGATWQRRTDLPGAPTLGGRTAQLRIHPADPLTALVWHYDAGLLLTRDGGGTWQSLTAPSTAIQELAFAPVGPPRLWASTLNGVSFSDNIGVNWTATSLIAVGDAVRPHPTLPGVIYASSTTNGLVRSSNNGTTWTSIANGPAVGRIINIDIAAAAPDRILVGGTEGIGATLDATNWTRRNAGFVGTRVSRVTPVAGTDRIYISAFDAPIHRLDGSATLATAVNEQAQRANTHGNLASWDAIAHARNPDRILASIGNAGVLRSLDAGNSWSLIPESTFGNRTLFSFAGSNVDTDIVLAHSNEQIFRSTNGGANWQAAQALPAGLGVRSLGMGNTHAYAGVGTLVAANIQNGRGVYRSSDQGVTWAAADSGIESSWVFSIAVDPTNDRRVVIGTDSGLMRSTDGGGTWTAIGARTAGISWYVAIDPTNPRMLYAAAAGRVVRTIDDGTTWEALRSETQLPQWIPDSIAVDPTRPNKLLVGATGVEVISIQPDLSLDLSGASSASTGATTSARLVATNLGPFHATNARLAIQVPESATAVSATVTNGAGTCTTAPGAVTCEFDTLLVNAARNVDVSLSLPTAGTYQIAAALTAAQPDMASANNSRALSIVVAAAPAPEPAKEGGGSDSALWLMLLGALGAWSRRCRSASIGA